MRITAAAHSTRGTTGYPDYRHYDVATQVCDDAEVAHLNALLERGALTVYHRPQDSYTDKVRSTEPDDRKVARFADYLITLEASDEERMLLECVHDIAEYATFHGEVDINRSRSYHRTMHVELRHDLTEEQFGRLWPMVAAYWTNTVELRHAWKAGYDAAQDAWQEMMR